MMEASAFSGTKRHVRRKQDTRGELIVDGLFHQGLCILEALGEGGVHDVPCHRPSPEDADVHGRGSVVRGLKEPVRVRTQVFQRGRHRLLQLEVTVVGGDAR